MDTEAPSTVWLLWTLLLETSGYRCPGVSLHLYLWGKSPTVQLLGHRAGLFITLWGTSTQFSRVAAPVHIPTNSVRGFLFSASSPTFVVSCLVNFPHSHWCDWLKMAYDTPFWNIIAFDSTPLILKWELIILSQCNKAPIFISFLLSQLTF